MQIAKEPLLYHLCVVAGEGQRRPKQVGGGGKKGKRYTCALTGYIMHQLNVPTAKIHHNPADVFSCRLSKSLDWLLATAYCHFCSKALGTEAAKKYHGPPAALVDTPPAVTHPGGAGAVHRFFLRARGSSFSVSRIWKRGKQLSDRNESVGAYLLPATSALVSITEE